MADEPKVEVSVEVPKAESVQNIPAATAQVSASEAQMVDILNRLHELENAFHALEITAEREAAWDAMADSGRWEEMSMLRERIEALEIVIADEESDEESDEDTDEVIIENVPEIPPPVKEKKSWDFFNNRKGDE